MSNIPNNIKKMWEAAANIEAIKKGMNKGMNKSTASIPGGPKNEVGGKIHGNRDEKGNLKN
jgi:hypothetical protein